MISRLDDVRIPTWRLHALTGDRQGQWALTVRANWRITFRFEDGDVFDVDLVDYHWTDIMMTMKNPTHPGEIVKGVIDDLDLSAIKAAEMLGVSRQQVTRLVGQKSGISPEMALRLEAVFGSTAEQWLRMQDAWALAQLRARKPAITDGLQRVAIP